MAIKNPSKLISYEHDISMLLDVMYRVSALLQLGLPLGLVERRCIEEVLSLYSSDTQQCY